MKRKESGHALVEAIVLGTLLMTAVLVLLMGLSGVHRAALAVGAAAREAAFAAARSPDQPSASRAAQDAAASALRNHGVRPGHGNMQLSAPDGYTRGATVIAQVVVRVPAVPLPGGDALRVTVRSERAVRIDPFRSEP